MNYGTTFDEESLQNILNRITFLIREKRAADADAIIDEYELREFLCGSGI